MAEIFARAALSPAKGLAYSQLLVWSSSARLWHRTREQLNKIVIGETTVHLSRNATHDSPELSLSLGYFLAVTRQRGR
jgi:hypothetical protein